jgi:hypothetical protein
MYTPIIVGGESRYHISLPSKTSPVRFWTITTPMQFWTGEVNEARDGLAEALVWVNGKLVPFRGMAVSALFKGQPCVVMEHLTIRGNIEYMIGRHNIMDNNKNFVNFGEPGGTHLRIDIYTGEYIQING